MTLVFNTQTMRLTRRGLSLSLALIISNEISASTTVPRATPYSQKTTLNTTQLIYFLQYYLTALILE